MKKISFIIALVIVTSLGLTAVFALNSATTGRMIDNYKTRHEKILFESLPFTATGANEVLEHEYRMNGLEALKTRLAEVEKYYAEKKQETMIERMTLEKAIKKIDDAIALTEKSINDTKDKITQKQSKIQALDHASIELKKKIASHREIILNYLANMYSEGNLIFDENGDVDVMKALLLTSEDTDYYLRDMTYKTIVSQLGQQFVDDYRQLVRDYYVMGVKTREERVNLQNLQTNLEKQNANYQSQKKEREELLEITKGQEELFQKHMLAQQQAQQQIADAWKKANEDYQKSYENFMSQYKCTEKMSSEECDRLKVFFSNEAELAKSEYAKNTDNIFVWPTDSRRVTAYFRDQSYFQAIGSHHDAVDIGTPQGSNVYAAADGYVYYIMQPTSPQAYSYVVIKHKDGLVTVYGHLSEVKIKPYQFVRQGELIALSGGTPGTNGAGPATTGAHLHFEVWKNKEPVDPLRFVPLYDIDYKNLPALYQTKFVNDLVEKNGENTDTSDYKIRFSLRGKTEEERQKYMLATYATKSFQSWEMWTDTALSANIDPSFLMCIGLSETTLGNHLKTPYNVGNVGNTDSGDTVSFASPQEGVLWMAKTFNNKYLGKYTKVSELSRWGNQTGPIYASSASNWHDNTIRCLSALKGRFVEDDYNFRISTK